MNRRDPYSESDASAADEADGESVDLDKWKETLGFIWRAPRRRPMLATAIFVVVAALGIAVAATMPKIYNAQVKLLAQRDLVGPNMINPGRAVPRDADNLTRNVADTILRRDNLLALIKDSNLLARWHATRSPALKLKDRLFALWAGPQTEADELRSLAQTIEKRMLVVSDESTVTISVDWDDPEIAYELVTLVQKNFVEARYDSDVAAIQRAISALEDGAKAASDEVDAALAAYQKQLANAAAGETATAAAPPTVISAPPSVVMGPSAAAQPAPNAATPDPVLANALEAKRGEIRAFEEERQRQISALKQQLFQAQLTLTPLHPTVLGLQERIDGMSGSPPELMRLRGEEAALMAQIAAPPAAPGSGNGSGSPAPAFPRVWSVPARPAGPGATSGSTREDPAVTLVHSRLESAIHRYQEVLAHLDSARLELDIARTASRYVVITPAEVAHATKRPIAAILGIGSVVLAALLGPLGAAAADWRTGRIIEPWQVRRRLKMKVLGELDFPG